MDVSAMLEAARRRLTDAPRVRLGELVRPRRVLGVARAPRIVPRLAAWHLGVLLLGDDALYATGEIVRAREQVRRGFTAESQRERDALAGAAFRGGYAEGETVHVGWRPIDLGALARGAASGPLLPGEGAGPLLPGEASGPLLPGEGAVLVRWNRAGGRTPLEAYLDEQVELLRHPPAGST